MRAATSSRDLADDLGARCSTQQPTDGIPNSNVAKLGDIDLEDELEIDSGGQARRHGVHPGLRLRTARSAQRSSRTPIRPAAGTRAHPRPSGTSITGATTPSAAPPWLSRLPTNATRRRFAVRSLPIRIRKPETIRRCRAKKLPPPANPLARHANYALESAQVPRSAAPCLTGQHRFINDGRFRSDRPLRNGGRS